MWKQYSDILSDILCYLASIPTFFLAHVPGIVFDIPSGILPGISSQAQKEASWPPNTKSNDPSIWQAGKNPKPARTNIETNWKNHIDVANTVRKRDSSSKMLQVAGRWEIYVPKRCKCQVKPPRPENRGKETKKNRSPWCSYLWRMDVKIENR